MSLRPFAYLKSVVGGGIEKKSVPLSDSFGLESIFGVHNTAAGPAINAETALRVPAVFSAIALLSGAIGSLPAKVFASAPSGKRAAPTHPAYRLVHDEANDWTSAGQLRADLTRDALLHDHGYALANRVNGKVIEFIRLDPRKVTTKADAFTGEPVYEYRDGSTVLVIGYRDMLHISAPLGVAPIKAGREAIALASILEKNAAKLFANGARPFGVIELGGALNGEMGAKTVANIRAAWQRTYGSGDNSTPLILDNGSAFKSVTMTSVDAQFLEMRVEQTIEIARLFRVPPHLLFELSRATWSNAEEMFQSFLTLTLRPWLDAWEWAYRRVLLSPEERLTHYVEFVIDDLVTANAETRANTYQAYRAMGVLTANEVRAGLNRAPIAGGDVLANPNITPGKPSGQNDNGTAGKEAA